MGLSKAEKLELEILLRTQNLYTLDEETNENYRVIFNALIEQEFDPVTKKLVKGHVGVILEGSSRSAKTWSWIFLIVYICKFVETSCTINIYRATFEEFKTTLYRDFKKVLDLFGIPNKFHDAERIKSFKIGKNTINFLGCDKLGKAHGAGCEYAIFNEMMHIPQDVFDQVEARCQKLWIGDYNPSYSQHWVFDKVLLRSDVAYLHSTFRGNIEHISPSELNKLLRSEPWKPGSYKVKNGKVYYRGVEVVTDGKIQPPPHPVNVPQGTADEYFWRVYGLGLRGHMEGMIFKNVTYIDQWPEHVVSGYTRIHGNDFGFTTDPNATVKYAEDEDNIWVELLIYRPIENPIELDAELQEAGIPKDTMLPCDSSDKYTGENKGTVEMVKGLIRRGWKNAFKISKKKSVMYWLLSMKTKKIHVIKNDLSRFVVVEQQHYVMKEIKGVPVNEPIDKYNHFWDATRYCHMAHNGCAEVMETTKSLKEMGISY